MKKLTKRQAEVLEVLEMYENAFGPFDPDDFMGGEAGRYGDLGASKRTLESLVARKLVERDAFGRYAILDAGRDVLFG
jgi:hypothetical protein